MSQCHELRLCLRHSAIIVASPAGRLVLSENFQIAFCISAAFCGVIKGLECLGLVVPLIYQGIRNEIVPGDSENRSWYIWQATTSPITTPGKHTYQFFSHYYVWQDPDQYWAEYNSYSTLYLFTIDDPKPTVSEMLHPETTKIVFSSIFAAALATANSFNSDNSTKQVH